MKKKTKKIDQTTSASGNALPLEQVNELIDLLEQRGLEEFELERPGVRIRIKRRMAGSPAPVARVVDAFANAAEPPSVPATAAPGVAPPLPAEERAEGDLHVVKSPIVGTFYAAPAPDAGPFVKVGDFVEVGQVLCVIEAMKLMNEIEADVAGEIVRIYVENAQPVEYGESLFALRSARKK